MQGKKTDIMAREGKTGGGGRNWEERRAQQTASDRN